VNGAVRYGVLTAYAILVTRVVCLPVVCYELNSEGGDVMVKARKGGGATALK